MTQDFWSAVGAIGQWAGAIATVVAVIVALNANKPKVKFKMVELASNFPNSPGMNAPQIGICFYNERNFIIRLSDAYFVEANNKQKIYSKDVIGKEIGSWNIVVSPYDLSKGLNKKRLNGKVKLYFILVDSSGREYRKSIYFDTTENRIIKTWYEKILRKLTRS